LKHDYLIVFQKELDGACGYALAYFSEKKTKTMDLISSTVKVAIDREIYYIIDGA